MGFIDDIAAEYANGDPELTRIFEQSYMEGIHSAWSLALASVPPTDQNEPASAKSLKTEYPEVEPIVVPATSPSSSPKLIPIYATA
jgi:hypothetical protein